tara:strand:+ start:202 stop:333 length:132 start_codon:yes stop_codon:yes gene_type:complete
MAKYKRIKEQISEDLDDLIDKHTDEEIEDLNVWDLIKEIVNES